MVGSLHPYERLQGPTVDRAGGGAQLKMTGGWSGRPRPHQRWRGVWVRTWPSLTGNNAFAAKYHGEVGHQFWLPSTRWL